MSSLRFEWDPAKSALNQMKHGVSFLEATTVFEDDDALWMPDPDHFEWNATCTPHGALDERRIRLQ
jgi:uncharacterized DUF497 family protein